MKNLVIYTTLIRRKDVPHDPLVIDPNADYVCFTDEPNFIKTNVYRLIEIEKIEDRKQALYDQKKFKFCPHLFDELKNYPYSVFHDANMQVKDNISNLVKLLNGAEIGFFSNSLSKTLGEEAQLFFNMIDGKDPNILDTKKEISEKLDGYYEQGFVDSNSIMTSGVIVRNQQNSKIKQFNELWQRESLLCDQVSLNFALWKNKMYYRDFGLTVYSEEYKRFFVYWRHNY